jgi:hypothetical protein
MGSTKDQAGAIRPAVERFMINGRAPAKKEKVSSQQFIRSKLFS